MQKEPLQCTAIKSSFMYKIYLFDDPVVILEKGLKRSGEVEKEKDGWSRKGSK